MGYYKKPLIELSAQEQKETLDEIDKLRCDILRILDSKGWAEDKDEGEWTHPALEGVFTKREAIEKESRVNPELYEADQLEVYLSKTIIEANLPLVIKVANNYRKYHRLYDDVVSDCQIALIKAVETYSPERGVEFGSHASFLMNSFAKKQIGDRPCEVKMPIHLLETAGKILQIINQLCEDLKREPTLKEISKATSLDQFALQKIFALSDELSIQAEINDNESSLGDIIPNKDDDPYREAELHLLQEEIRLPLDGLDDRWRNILTMRFGLPQGFKKTLAELALEYPSTRARLEEIEIEISLSDEEREIMAKIEPYFKKLGNSETPKPDLLRKLGF